jgi:DNA-binding IclR family transcriptional regulator
MGKVLLAFSPGSPKDLAASLQHLTRFTDTPSRLAALATELTGSANRVCDESGRAIRRRVRHRRPVLAADGSAHAAVGIQGPSLRLTTERLDGLAVVVSEAADEVGLLVLRS